ncbi:MAG TPA: response regulator [Verrucomicrobiae bacterium]|nr:response regulator [Verrucomicrobiae bacterium]
MGEEAQEVLLVEDGLDDVAFFMHAFTQAGLAAHLRVVRDGAEALDFIFCTGPYAQRGSANRPKLIILDLKLPKVDGVEVLRRLKEDSRTRMIPVVILSSSQEERDLVESYALGVNSFVVKPMDFDQFSQSVRMIAQYWLQLNHTPKP